MHPVSSPIFKRFPSENLNVARLAIAALVGTALLTLSAKLQVPFFPVPMTLQTYAALLLGMVFGPTLGSLAVLLYVFEGLIGLPVFAGSPERGVGVAYLLGPTGGYIVGFVVAAWLIGLITSRTSNRWIVAIAATVSVTTIYLCGVTWLSGFVGWEQVWTIGVAPFIPGEILKIALALGTFELWSRLRMNAE